MKECMPTLELICKYGIVSLDLGELDADTFAKAEFQTSLEGIGRYKSVKAMKSGRKKSACPDENLFHLPCGPFKLPASSDSRYLDTCTKGQNSGCEGLLLPVLAVHGPGRTWP